MGTIPPWGRADYAPYPKTWRIRAKMFCFHPFCVVSKTCRGGRGGEGSDLYHPPSRYGATPKLQLHPDKGLHVGVEGNAGSALSPHFPPPTPSLPTLSRSGMPVCMCEVVVRVLPTSPYAPATCSNGVSQLCMLLLNSQQNASSPGPAAASSRPRTLVPNIPGPLRGSKSPTTTL